MLKCGQCGGVVKKWGAKICRECYLRADANEKTCSVCKTPKSLSEFKPRAGYRYGVNSVCRACDNEARRKLYHRDPVKARNSVRVNKLKTAYGLTEGAYIEMCANGCNICGNSCPTGRRLAVDHCHFTGKIRGVLCSKCNQALGLFSDSITLLEKAKSYLIERG